MGVAYAGAEIDRGRKEIGAEQQRAALRGRLGDRLFVLDQPSLEEYLPESLYQRIGKNKVQVLEELRRFRSDWQRTQRMKAELSSDVTRELEEVDLDSIRVIRDAAVRATQLCDGDDGKGRADT